MSTVRTTYDDPALAGRAIARDQTRELLSRQRRRHLLGAELFGGSRE
jgi:hypothetical protein